MSHIFIGEMLQKYANAEVITLKKTGGEKIQDCHDPLSRVKEWVPLEVLSDEVLRKMMTCSPYVRGEIDQEKGWLGRADPDLANMHHSNVTRHTPPALMR